MEEREAKIEKDANNKIETYKIEVEALRIKCENIFKNFEKFMENNEDLKANHKKELGDYVKE